MIKRVFIKTGGESPQIGDDFNNPQFLEIVSQKGFLSIPDVNDEVIVLCPYGNDLDRVICGVIEPALFGLEQGDRLILTDNAYIKLKKDGTIDILSNGGTINIKSNSGTINIGDNGQNVNINGNVSINGTPV
jgi:hypothetical protein